MAGWMVEIIAIRTSTIVIEWLRILLRMNKKEKEKEKEKLKVELKKKVIPPWNTFDYCTGSHPNIMFCFKFRPISRGGQSPKRFCFEFRPVPFPSVLAIVHFKKKTRFAFLARNFVLQKIKIPKSQTSTALPPLKTLNPIHFRLPKLNHQQEVPIHSPKSSISPS